MICDFCGKNFDEKPIKFETYKGIDEHHNPPQFMLKCWKGETYNLCREHHRKLHDIQIKMLNEIAETLKFVKSEHWVWLQMNQNQRDKAVKEIYEFTKKWVKNGNKDT